MATKMVAWSIRPQMRRVFIDQGTTAIGGAHREQQHKRNAIDTKGHPARKIPTADRHPA